MTDRVARVRFHDEDGTSELGDLVREDEGVYRVRFDRPGRWPVVVYEQDIWPVNIIDRLVKENSAHPWAFVEILEVTE